MLSDSMIGWIIIVAVSAGFYFGVTRLVRFFVNSADKAAHDRRAERDRIQDELDDESRDELFRILEAERLRGEEGIRRK